MWDMSGEADSARSGRAMSEAGADDEVLAWISGPPESKPTGDDACCPTCGFAGEMVAGPDALTCPACLAEYPKLVAGQGPVLMMVRCAGCGLAIGITDSDRDRTLICPRCKYFLGCVLQRIGRRAWRAGRPSDR